jgi:hypothetical protein
MWTHVRAETLIDRMGTHVVNEAPRTDHAPTPTRKRSPHGHRTDSRLVGVKDVGAVVSTSLPSGGVDLERRRSLGPVTTSSDSNSDLRIADQATIAALREESSADFVTNFAVLGEAHPRDAAPLPLNSKSDISCSDGPGRPTRSTVGISNRDS